ncbi:electron transfer flavoprotein subunit beta/FixA family protein [Paraburkholderia caribensis]|uniref:Electron transfer flavoprotein alpha/beta-subunit n=2 Tax=Paraburkholderia TaxID=1822464 RepID=B2JSB6_PARP8|nr:MULTISPECIES: electron transfer flavoprotein subunit beta/FixA family protein [Paraburkholderia]ACC73936.1 Electron transfer flavoprotein alpha/beta-subunit [Paraburkholderia phymatum STM815]MCO4878248.1 electron transfer flavoprotein subunit beta/FixA family protein [Paraburkholderia caribensis]PTB28712.1 electron transfer flavoprotein subunit beta/FixA family protein [Paraburkholderia caribensis]QLB66529.1 electron transfer flavoprotein subunit beta [Paraburkholderia caribensis]
MHIVVTLKQVHDPNTSVERLELGPDGKSIKSPAGVSDVANGYDVNAVEEALKIREKVGGSVTVIGVGGEDLKGHLRRALAMGADKAVHVEGPSGINSDPFIVSTLLAGAMEKLPAAELVLCGRQASDTDGGQVLFRLAERLRFSALSPVKQVVAVDDATVQVDRLTDDGVQRVQAAFPVLLGISNEANKPRSPSLKGVMQSKKAEIPTLTASDLGIGQLTASVVLRRIYFPEVSDARAEIVSAENGALAGRALAERLHQEGVL